MAPPAAVMAATQIWAEVDDGDGIWLNIGFVFEQEVTELMEMRVKLRNYGEIST